MFGWIAAISRPSAIMPAASSVVAFTSPEMGPSTMDAISRMTSPKSRPSFAIRLGFVVTPQITPISLAFLMSSTFAVSIKNFIAPCPFPFCFERLRTPPKARGFNSFSIIPEHAQSQTETTFLLRFRQKTARSVCPGPAAAAAALFYIILRYSAAISSTLVSRGLPGRHASAKALSARNCTSSSFTMVSGPRECPRPVPACAQRRRRPWVFPASLRPRLPRPWRGRSPGIFRPCTARCIP